MNSLHALFNGRYHMPNLVVLEEEFRQQLSVYLARMDESKWMPGKWGSFLDSASWGHNHDFGDGFMVRGRMEDRHIRVAQRFVDQGILPKDLTGLKILVVGCYTGGDALLLAAMGATVVALEEHPLYAEIAAFLAEAFGAGVTVLNLPLRQLDKRLRFDLIYCAGVVYHLKDPLGGLELMRGLLKPECPLLVESMTLGGFDEESFIWYQGRQHPGYNWFVPTPNALVRMMRDCGFEEVECLHHEDLRGYFVGVRPAISDVG